MKVWVVPAMLYIPENIRVSGVAGHALRESCTPDHLQFLGVETDDVYASVLHFLAGIVHGLLILEDGFGGILDHVGVEPFLSGVYCRIPREGSVYVSDTQIRSVTYFTQ